MIEKRGPANVFILSGALLEPAKFVFDDDPLVEKIITWRRSRAVRLSNIHFLILSD